MKIFRNKIIRFLMYRKIGQITDEINSNKRLIETKEILIDDSKMLIINTESEIKTVKNNIEILLRMLEMTQELVEEL